MGNRLCCLFTAVPPEEANDTVFPLIVRTAETTEEGGDIGGRRLKRVNVLIVGLHRADTLATVVRVQFDLLYETL